MSLLLIFTAGVVKGSVSVVGRFEVFGWLIGWVRGSSGGLLIR